MFISGINTFIDAGVIPGSTYMSYNMALASTDTTLSHTQKCEIRETWPLRLPSCRVVS